MQFAPGAAFRSSMFFEQPFAGSAQFQPRAVNDQVQVARSNPRPFGNRQSARPPAQRRMIRDGQVDLQHSHDRANQPFALAKRQSKHRSQCQSSLNGEIGIVRLAARRGSGLRLPTSQRFVGEPNREASTIAKRCVIVTPVRHSMPLTWNVASALGMEFERHDRSSRWQRRSSVPKLLKRPPRPYPCTKVTVRDHSFDAHPGIDGHFVQWRVGGYRRYRPWSRSDLRLCQNHADPFASAWDPVAATASRL